MRNDLPHAPIAVYAGHNHMHHVAEADAHMAQNTDRRMQGLLVLCRPQQLAQDKP